MEFYAIKRSLEILRKDGPLELAKSSKRFLQSRILSSNRQFQINTLKNHYITQLRFDAPANPLKIIYIQPQNVVYRGKGIASYRRGLGQIKTGNWEDELESIENTAIFRGIKQRFKEGRNWEETVLYEQALNLFDEKNSVRTTQNIDEFLNERCPYVDRLYTDIKENGYKQASKIGNDTKNFRGDIRDKLEILVTIDVEGDIHLIDGQHRFAIAHILDLEIPVQVVARHEQWQKTRDDIYNNVLSQGRGDAIRNHPDLQDVLD